MPRYFFHLDECGTVIADPEGSELPDLDAARERAGLEARQIMSAEIKQGMLCLGCCIVICGPDNAEITRVRFRDVVTVSGLQPG